MGDLPSLAVLKTSKSFRAEATNTLAVRIGDNRIHLDKIHIEMKRVG